MNEPYTLTEVGITLKGNGFKYTVHGIRKQVEMGCIPSYTLLPRKRKLFTNKDLKYFFLTACLRSLGLTLREIKRLNTKIFLESPTELFTKELKEISYLIKLRIKSLNEVNSVIDNLKKGGN